MSKIHIKQIKNTPLAREHSIIVFNGTDNVWTVSAKEAIQLPAGTSAERPSANSTYPGLLRYNTTVSSLEFYDGTNWVLLNGGGGSLPSTTSAGWYGLVKVNSQGIVTSGLKYPPAIQPFNTSNLYGLYALSAPPSTDPVAEGPVRLFAFLSGSYFFINDSNLLYYNTIDDRYTWRVNKKGELYIGFNTLYFSAGSQYSLFPQKIEKINIISSATGESRINFAHLNDTNVLEEKWKIGTGNFSITNDPNGVSNSTYDFRFVKVNHQTGETDTVAKISHSSALSACTFNFFSKAAFFNGVYVNNSFNGSTSYYLPTSAGLPNQVLRTRGLDNLTCYWDSPAIPYAIVGNGNIFQSFSTTSLKLRLDNTTYQTSNANYHFSLGTNEIIINKAGYYLITFKIGYRSSYVNTGTYNYIYAYFGLNGTLNYENSIQEMISHRYQYGDITSQLFLRVTTVPLNVSVFIRRSGSANVYVRSRSSYLSIMTVS